jgi:hypothetical protein
LLKLCASGGGLLEIMPEKLKRPWRSNYVQLLEEEEEEVARQRAENRTSGPPSVA